MKSKCVLFTISGALLSIVLCGQMAMAQCQSTSPNCVDVELGTTGQAPSVNPPTVRFRKSVGGASSKFSFGLKDSPGSQGTVYVIFKCQDYDAQPFDCRTPAVHASGNATWALKLTPNGVTPAVSLGPLDKCTTECGGMTDESNYEECVQQFCRYPYMVMEIQGNSASPNPPMDPDVVIDPK